MKNVLVLGAGKIGRMVASLLQGCGDYQVTVMDAHEASVHETLALAPGAKPMVGKFDDLAAVDRALEGQWALVSCAPDRKSTRLNSSHVSESRMPSSA